MPGGATISWITRVENLLLDTYPAAAAYSLRRLRTAYSGSAIRIRRSNDNSETDIGFNGNNLDTSAITSFVGSNDAFVTTWYDQTGNSRNLTQSTAGKQPIIVTAGTIETFNSRPELRFDGARTMRTANGQLNSGTVDTFAAMQNTSVARTLFGLPHATTHTSPFFRYSLYYNVSFFVRLNGTETSSSGNTNYNVINLNSSTGDLYLNGSINSNQTGATLTYPNSVPFILGSNADDGEAMIGNVFELIVYTSDQSSNRSTIESDMNAYYSIY